MRSVIQKGGVLQGVRRALNFIAGSNITLTVTDNATENRVDVTIASTGGGGGGGGTGTIIDLGNRLTGNELMDLGNRV